MRTVKCHSSGGERVRADRAGDRKAAVRIHIDHAIDEPLRRYGLAQVLAILGAPYLFSRSAEADIYYGDDLLQGRSARVWICPEHRSNWREHHPVATLVDRLPILHHGPAPRGLIDRNRIDFDLPLCAAYWLTLSSESRIWPRDEHGRVSAVSSLLSRLGLLEHPPLQGYSALLGTLLWPLEAPDALLSRWPDGKRWAVALTHDVLRIEDSKRDRRGLLDFIRRRSQLPLELFDFCKTEEAAGLKSAFFFGVTSARAGHRLDVEYDLKTPSIRRAIRRLARSGFEIGLQAAFGTQWDCPPSRSQVALLCNIAGGSAVGVRHHLLHLAPDDPMATLMNHAGAGFRYDSSIGFVDQAGFRAGTALPFAPFHEAHGSADCLVELPLTLSDRHVSAESAEEAVAATIRHLQRVRDLGGLAVLSWPVGQSDRSLISRAAYQAACEFISKDGGAWCALPGQIADWWLERGQRLSEGVIESADAINTITPRACHWPAAQGSTSNDLEPSLQPAGHLVSATPQTTQPGLPFLGPKN